MAYTPIHTDSYYAASVGEIPHHSALTESVQADVCVIGGGFTGVSSALHLAEAGFSVVLLEAEKIGWGASGRNGGHVGTGQRQEQRVLEKMLGKAAARKLWDLSIDSVELVKSLINDHAIDCDLKSGILHLAAKAREVEQFKADAQHLTEAYDYEDVEFLDRERAVALSGNSSFHAGLLDRRSVHLHPLKYVLGLAAAARKAGVRIYENSRVTSFNERSKVNIRTEHGSVEAGKAILACNAYLNDLAPTLSRRIMPINNFVLATEPLSDELAEQVNPEDFAMTDSRFVVNYWKLSADRRMIFGGGETYRKKFPADIKKFVRKHMLGLYPQLESVGIDYAWGGSLAITLNRMPHYGQYAASVYFAHGYSGHGIPTATMAGKLLAEAMSGNRERFDLLASVPTPSFPGGSSLRWPALVLGMSYYSLRDKL